MSNSPARKSGALMLFIMKYTESMLQQIELSKFEYDPRLLEPLEDMEDEEA